MSIDEELSEICEKITIEEELSTVNFLIKKINIIINEYIDLHKKVLGIFPKKFVVSKKFLQELKFHPTMTSLRYGWYVYDIPVEVDENFYGDIKLSNELKLELL